MSLFFFEDVDQNEEFSMKHSVSYPPLMTTSMSKRNTSFGIYVYKEIK